MDRGVWVITGGLGYIGQSVAWAVLARGRPVVLVDRQDRSPTLGGVPVVRGSVADPAVWEAVLAHGRPELVIHCAGLIVVSESVRDPAAYYRENVVAGVAMLDHLRHLGPVPVVFSSSAAVYGHPVTVPIPEDAPKEPVTPYGATKWMFEQVLAHYHQAYGLSWMALRYFNAAGSVGGIREAHDPETHLMPRVAAALARGEAPEVYGTHYPTRDGSAVRDFVHVADLAEAHLLAGEYLLAGGRPEAINLGSGRGVTVLEVVSTFQRLLGRPIAPRRLPPRPGDPPVLVAAIERARRVLGWEPRRTDLEAMAKEVLMSYV
ncbi:MAG: UDP-glucose 4-epimerase GalE [Firmicutes bacterium]|nr:UDP-glucose 4-epimerase GalE [Alicyclobacillaceae bacterium]MCL6497118.1 UDP-glucose 4-epimerase GalE [Bacillota bacterium]